MATRAAHPSSFATVTHGILGEKASEINRTMENRFRFLAEAIAQARDEAKKKDSELAANMVQRLAKITAMLAETNRDVLQLLQLTRDAKEYAARESISLSQAVEYALHHSLSLRLKSLWSGRPILAIAADEANKAHI